MQTKVTQALVRARLEGNLFEILVCLGLAYRSQRLAKILPMGAGGVGRASTVALLVRLAPQQVRRAFGCPDPSRDGIVWKSRHSQNPGRMV